MSPEDPTSPSSSGEGPPAKESASGEPAGPDSGERPGAEPERAASPTPAAAGAPEGAPGTRDSVAATRERVEAALRGRTRAGADSGAVATGRFGARPARPSAPEPGRRAGPPERAAGEDAEAEAPGSGVPEMTPEAIRARVVERLDEAEGRKATRREASGPQAAPKTPATTPPRKAETVPVASDPPSPVTRPDPDDSGADPPDRTETGNDSDPARPGPPGFVSRIAALIATCGFLGRIPPAPGTLGALAGLGAFHFAGRLPDPAPGLLFLAAVVVGVWAAGRHARDLGQKDPAAVVVDEFCGMWLALLATDPSLVVAGVAFVGFRLLDILKPPPIRQAERLPGGLGIMADDLIAGAFVRAGLFVAVGL